MNLMKVNVPKSREDSDDIKISFAIIASTVILMIQFFILTTFNILDTSIGSKVQLMSKVFVAIILIYSFPVVLKRVKLQFFLVYYIAIFIFCLHFILFPENRMYMKELIFPFFFTCLPTFVYSMSLQNWNVFKQVLQKASVIVFILGLLLGIQITLGIASVGTYSMTFSYYMLFPTIIHLNELLDRYSFKSLMISLSSIFIILAIGSRGAFLCIAVFILLKLLRPNRELLFSKVRMFFFFSFVLVGLFIVFNLQKLLFTIQKILVDLGIQSRSISLFLKGEVSLSGREDIYQRVITEILQHPVLGIGLGGDRLAADGVYAHNIILEIVSNFGVIIGGVFIFILFFTIMKFLFVKELDIYNMIIIWVSIGLISLFVSGSYLTEIQFWVLMGLIVGYYLHGPELVKPNEVTEQTEI
ncbi:O-antigen ligase-like membrane protein [Ureibacillus xyleni]|uniref:O-antigen ligase-like membrane protein n=1 Tax=Ureibacillus xyleni TaxID=614648 RepID=A0A285RJ20_9BACL|nr:O-antigen ligase family protein [Ureibacillus xyleni]SOB93669.1 O-antigen ligase-like membrane protein [Ureibacillus xyleni]